MKKTYLIFLFFLVSCSSRVHNPVGHYQFYAKDLLSGIIINIKQDSTYQFVHGSDEAESAYSLEGTWKIRGRELFLSSNKRPLNPPFSEEYSDTVKNGKYFLIFNEQGQPLNNVSYVYGYSKRNSINLKHLRDNVYYTSVSDVSLPFSITAVHFPSVEIKALKKNTNIIKIYLSKDALIFQNDHEYIIRKNA